MTTITDTFTRADSAVSLGNADTGQAWTNERGTWGISGNAMYNPVSGAPGACTIDLGSTDGYVQATLTATGASTEFGFWFRWTDFNNTYFVDAVPGGKYQFFKRVAGAQTTLATGTHNCALNDVTRVSFVGTSIRVTVNGVSDITVTDSAISAGTRVGIRNGAQVASRYDNFSASSDVSAAAGTVTSTATAYSPIAAPGIFPGTATSATATAYSPVAAPAALAGTVTATATAYGPLPAPGIRPGTVTATATAYGPTVAIGPAAGTVTAAATAQGSTAVSTASAGTASCTATVYDGDGRPQRLAYAGEVTVQVFATNAPKRGPGFSAKRLNNWPYSPRLERE